MRLKLPMSLVDKALEANPSDAFLLKSKETSVLRRYVELDGLRLSKATLKFLYLETRESTTACSGSIAFLYSALKNKKSAKIINMDGAKLAMVNYITNEFLSGYVFKQGDFNSVLPYLVLSVEDNTDESSRYSRRDGPDVKQLRMTIIHADASGVEHQKTLSFSPSSLNELALAKGLTSEEVVAPGTKNRSAYCYDFTCREGISVEDVLQSRGFFKETTELHELYESQRTRFMKFLPLYGTQFRVRGESSSSYYMSGENMLVEGKPGRCIIDTIPSFCFSSRDSTDSGGRDDDDDEDSYSGRYRTSKGDKENAKFASLDELEIKLTEIVPQDFQKSHELVYHSNTPSDSPLHPTMKIFHLEKQRYYSVHVNNLVPYKYKEDISKYLVLPDEMKEMTEMLVGVSNNSEDLEDVIEGKSQSTVITCIGDPGVGKTLMAEVISEACKKPLYKIPADQLGGEAEQIEQNLKTILRRAERWDCVLMIDEANAYIHARGHDIRQNAIVGVFLRRIEYFKGILIVTTNQTNDDNAYDIDDAFLSRSNVVFRLTLPSPANAKKIWLGQAELQKIEISEKLIDKLVAKYHLSGRSIRKLLKLSHQWATHKEEKLAMPHFDYCFTTIPKTNTEGEREQPVTA